MATEESIRMARQSAVDSMDILSEYWNNYQRICDHEECDMPGWECEESRRELIDNFFLDIERDGNMVTFVIGTGGPATRVRYYRGQPALQYANWYTDWMDLELSARDYRVLCDIYAHFAEVIP